MVDKTSLEDLQQCLCQRLKDSTETFQKAYQPQKLALEQILRIFKVVRQDTNATDEMHSLVDYLTKKVVFKKAIIDNFWKEQESLFKPLVENHRELATLRDSLTFSFKAINEFIDTLETVQDECYIKVKDFKSDKENGLHTTIEYCIAANHQVLLSTLDAAVGHLTRLYRDICTVQAEKASKISKPKDGKAETSESESDQEESMEKFAMDVAEKLMANTSVSNVTIMGMTKKKRRN